MNTSEGQPVSGKKPRDDEGMFGNKQIRTADYRRLPQITPDYRDGADAPDP